MDMGPLTPAELSPITLSPFASELEARLAGRYGPTMLYPDDVRLAANTRGFVTVAKIIDCNTGRWVQVDAEIHVGDVDWLIRLHQDRFNLDWKLDEAARQKAHSERAEAAPR